MTIRRTYNKIYIIPSHSGLGSDDYHDNDDEMVDSYDKAGVKQPNDCSLFLVDDIEQKLPTE